MDANGFSCFHRLSDTTPNVSNPFTTAFNFTINQIQDPQTSLGEETTALNGFSYELNIEYIPDGYLLNGADLSPTNTPAEVQTKLATAASTLSNSAVPITGIKGQNGILTTLPTWTITVVGETDGATSTHTPQTNPNTQPIGNPALAQDRANVVANVLRTLLPTRTINTDIITGSGGADSSKRNIHLNITR